MDASTVEISTQMEQIRLKVEQVKQKNTRLNETLQIVAGIAEETAAGVQEVNSSSQHQDLAIRKIAEQAVEINGLSRDLFAEINQFEITDHPNELTTEPTFKEMTPEIAEQDEDASKISNIVDDLTITATIELPRQEQKLEAASDDKKKELVLV